MLASLERSSGRGELMANRRRRRSVTSLPFANFFSSMNANFVRRKRVVMCSIVKISANIRKYARITQIRLRARDRTTQKDDNASVNSSDKIKAKRKSK